MKMQIDQAYKNNQRPPRELAVLYRRFIYLVDLTIAPPLKKI